MNPTQHPSNNKVFGAPEGWDQQTMPCQALPVTVQLVDDQPCIVSYWRPTADELAQLVAGGLVGLHIYGRGMPPVWVQAEPDPMLAATPTPTPQEERKRFEHWYACNAFDYAANPVGSRECGLQWAAWRAALDLDGKGGT